MRALRYVYVLALVMWLGGMAIAGLVVAPTTFGVLEAWNPSTGRVLAGEVFGAVLRRLYLVGVRRRRRDVRRPDACSACSARGRRSYGIRVGLHRR